MGFVHWLQKLVSALSNLYLQHFRQRQCGCARGPSKLHLVGVMAVGASPNRPPPDPMGDMCLSLQENRHLLNSTLNPPLSLSAAHTATQANTPGDTR